MTGKVEASKVVQEKGSSNGSFIKDGLNEVWDQLLRGEEEKTNALRGEEEEEKEEVVVEEIEEVSAEDQSDEPESKAVEEPDEESEDAEEPTQEEEEIEPLENWSEDVKEHWGDLPKDVKLYLINTYKNMQADYTRKTQGVAHLKKALDPIRDQIEASGVDDATVITNFVGAHRLLQLAPYSGIKHLFESYGLDPQLLIEHWDDPRQADITVNPASSELHNKHNRLIAEAKARKEEGDKTWSKFASSHEYAEKLRPYMQSIAVAEARSGKKPEDINLETLYEKAMWLDPETRHIAERKSKDKRLLESVEEKKESIKKAKNAKKTVKRGSVTSEPAPPKELSLREELALRLDGKL